MSGSEDVKLETALRIVKNMSTVEEIGDPQKWGEERVYAQMEIWGFQWDQHKQKWEVT